MKKMAKNFSNNTFIQFVNRNRERMALAGVGFVFLLFVGGGLYIQKHKNKLDTVPPDKAAMKSVSLNVRPQGAAKQQESGSAQQSESFFLRPSPDELLQQLASMENLNETVADAKITGLRVLWPVYYFSHQDEGAGKATLLLDVSEDGFGVLIQSEVELSAHPSLANLQAGQKVWIGGEILAVDPAGTGTIYLRTEHLGTSEEQSLPAGVQPSEQ
jgi:hypothetical protein